MRRDLRGENAVAHVLDRRQPQVFGRSHVAQDVRARRGGDRPADGARDVIVPRPDVACQRAEDVEGRAAADSLLEQDVRLHLVDRHVTRSLDHHLHRSLVRPARQLAEGQELLDLRRVGGVAGGPRPDTVAERQRQIVLEGDVEEPIVVLQEGVLLACARHP